FQTPGFITDPYDYMSHAGVFVLSSLYEGLPGVLIQAMASGTPLVATDCPSGPKEVLQTNKWGKLVPIGDANAMADGIV
ncbi:glycosyltransferase, partial [Acinetobacter baumannii]